MEDKIIKKVYTRLKEQGFNKILLNNSPRNLFWSFDLFAEDKERAWAIEIRKNNEVNSIFIEKIKRIKKFNKSLSIYVLFPKPPKKKTYLTLSELGVGILILKDKEIFVFLKSKDFSKKVIEKKIIKKRLKRIRRMPQIFAFVSSKQNEKSGGKILKERKKVCSIIDRVNKTHSIPIFPLKIEDKFDGSRLFKNKITKNIKKSDIFICTLKDDYGEYVEYEIKKALKYIEDKKLILIFVKNINPENIEAPQLKLIEYVREKGKIHTIPYSNIKEFDNLITQYLMKMITRLYNKHKIKSPFCFS